MTYTDFASAISRHCERLSQGNVNPDRVSQIRATLHTLHNFLWEVQRDMEGRPELFEHPHWGYGPALATANPAATSYIVAGVARSMSPVVVRIRYMHGDDWQGSPSIFFHVVLSDAAVTRGQLLTNSNRVKEAIRAKLDFDSMGLNDYYNYRSKSECDKLRDEGWD
jgi:hypothetical protein